MIAVAKIGGHQALVQMGDVVEVDKLDTEVGKTASFETLLISSEDGKDFQMGTPLLTGVMVEAKVIEHTRGDKIRVYKMKPRKRCRKTIGHKQDYTIIEITKIGAAGTAKKPAIKKEAEVKAEEKKEVKKGAKKAPTKKPAAKKATVKKAKK